MYCVHLAKTLAPNTPQIDRVSAPLHSFRVGLINSHWQRGGLVQVSFQGSDVQFYLDNPEPWLSALFFDCFSLDFTPYMAGGRFMLAESGQVFRKDWRNSCYGAVASFLLAGFINLTYPFMNS